MSDQPTPHVLLSRPWYRPMVARSPDEEHRVATPLELFFDLCFVVAVAQAGAQLHHDLSEGKIGHGVAGYVLVFFAIWWAWMNFTWFASAYDTDDYLYRVTTLVQITGALILAAGIPRAFETGNFTVPTFGYVVMRLAMVSQWLRAARGDPAGRPTALRYAFGVSAVQIGWLCRLLLPVEWLLPGFLLLGLADLAVPIWAELHRGTTWHRQHIAERYGQFTLIVLGESVLASTVAIQSILDTSDPGALLLLVGAGLVILFSIWWLYFDKSPYQLLSSFRRAVLWGYGHYLVFASIAAVGAGLQVAVDHDRGAAHLPARAAGFAIAGPVAVYLFSVWALHVRARQHALLGLILPAAALLVLATPFTAAPVQLTALLLAALVTATAVAGRRTQP